MSDAVHIIPGRNNPACGIAVAANMLTAAGFGEEGETWVHSMWLPSVILGSVAALLRGRKLILMPHGGTDPLRLKYHWHKKRWLVPIERWLFRCAERIVATCEAEVHWIQQFEPKVKQVQRIDLKRFYRLPSSNITVKPLRMPVHLLYLGRRHPLKGIEYLEKAVADCSNVELKIISGAFGEDKENAWEWCDVLVHPTLSENFGLVIAEALERGKRVITTDGAPEWSDGNDYGGRLIYLKGYRDGDDKQRVDMLSRAIKALVCTYS